MNVIQSGMRRIRATEELKAETLRRMTERRSISGGYRRYGALCCAAAVCLLLLLGGYSLYIRPVTYISMDINPSIELGINRLGRVVSVEAYNEDGGEVLRDMALTNAPYVRAVSEILEDEAYRAFLGENSLLVFTVISDDAEEVARQLEVQAAAQSCQVMTYTSDMICRQEAHLHEMSFGKYRAYLELAQYDAEVTVEDCHGMTIGEIQDRIEGCSRHETEGGQGHHNSQGGGHNQGGHHGRGH